MRIDIHNHSTFSDGEFTPDKLISVKASLGIDLIGITDHYDAIKDIDYYFETLKSKSKQYKKYVTTLTGVEIDILGQHVVVFGEQYIKDIFYKYEDKVFDFIPETNHPHTLIIAHPDIDRLKHELLEKADAIEVTIFGSIHGAYSQIDILSEQYNLFKIASSDTHTFNPAVKSHTEIFPANIKNEKDLIYFLKDKEKQKKLDKYFYYLSDLSTRFNHL